MERAARAGDTAGIIGIDIDSYNIATMRKLVRLEKKTSFQLAQIKEQLSVPFAVKGVFTEEDIALVKEVKPDIAVISNHGGRVENRTGSTAQFLFEYGAQLAKYCGEIWIDGGIRRMRDLYAAKKLGASEVMIGRPFISALCRGSPLTLENVLLSDTDTAACVSQSHTELRSTF
jgi:isopentenyl diphosphate isomerase/L-lactate dehydrogenase-like FMN-dependent dehydrogenase